MSSYPAIRMFIGISQVLSWIVAAVAAVAGVVTLIGITATSGQFGVGAAIGGFFLGLLEALFIWFAGFLGWLGFRVLPEVLTVLVSIEANTQAKELIGSSK